MSQLKVGMNPEHQDCGKLREAQHSWLLVLEKAQDIAREVDCSNMGVALGT